MNKHLVTYMGSGLWRDGEDKLWGEVEGRSEVVRKRVFKSAKSQEEFLEDRKDIKFMVEYGQISIETLSTEDQEDKVNGEQISTEKEKDKKPGISIMPQ